jgi:hypothetical protein
MEHFNTSAIFMMKSLPHLSVKDRIGTELSIAHRIIGNVYGSPTLYHISIFGSDGLLSLARVNDNQCFWWKQSSMSGNLN